MLDLALSILFTSLLFVIFKLFDVYKVQTLYAIITNYIVAGALGIYLYNSSVIVQELPKKPWFIGTIVLGILFILVFNIMAKTAQIVGVSVASLATKMSLVIPVVFGLFLYNDKLGVLNTLGIILALVAVYLASIKPKEKEVTIGKEAWVLPILVFIGSGFIDTSLKYLQEKYVANNELPLFSAMVFFAAAIVGIVFILAKTLKTPLKLNLKNIVAGFVLGIPNYFSIYYLLRALQHKSLNSASVFTINNVAVVLLSTLLGILLFKEKISLKNWLGIALAVLSIILVAFF